MFRKNWWLGLLVMMFVMCQGLVEAKGAGVPMVNVLGNQVTLQLDANPSTGFTWLVVYKTDNVTEGAAAFASSDARDNTCGAPGTQTLAYTVNGGETAQLVLKYARPWEGELPGQYLLLDMALDGSGKIVNTETQQRLFNRETKQVKARAKEPNVRLYTFIPKKWSCDGKVVDGRPMLYLRPKAGGVQAQLAYAPQAEVTGAADRTEGPVRLACMNLHGKDYVLVSTTERELLLAEGSDVLWTAEQAWPKEYFLDVLVMLDNLDVYTD